LDVEHADVDAFLEVADVRGEGGELLGVDETILFLEEGARGFEGRWPEDSGRTTRRSPRRSKAL
jgi:hypothetical protein